MMPYLETVKLTTRSKCLVSGGNMKSVTQQMPSLMIYIWFLLVYDFGIEERSNSSP